MIYTLRVNVTNNTIRAKAIMAAAASQETNASQSSSGRKRKSRKEGARLDEIFVKLVQKDKDLLFGSFKGDNDHSRKIDKWEEIRVVMVNAGEIALSNKNSEYVRKHYWQNRRKKALNNRDVVQVSGSSPADSQLSEA